MWNNPPMNTTRKSYPTQTSQTKRGNSSSHACLSASTTTLSPNTTHAQSSTPASTSSPPTARTLPHDFPPSTPVSYHFHRVSARCLAADLSSAAWGGSPASSTLIVDSQTVQGASKGRTFSWLSGVYGICTQVSGFGCLRVQRAGPPRSPIAS